MFLQPAVAPTSKNFPEMREKLRLKLKKKVRYLVVVRIKSLE